MSTISSTAASPDSIECLLLDLDGTLADTAPDLSGALNRLLRQYGKAPLPVSTLRPWISRGAVYMISRAFSVPTDYRAMESMRLQFLEYYREDIASETKLYGGIGQVLDYCEMKNIPWGIVTNKSMDLARLLIEKLGLDRRCACLVGVGLLKHRKPHPEPLLFACRSIDVSARRSVYVGDASTDVIAAKRAGMISVVANYGYLTPEEDTAEWGADHYIEQPAALISLINGTDAG